MISDDTPRNHYPCRRLSMRDLVERLTERKGRKAHASHVLVAFCFSDELPLKACLAGCKEARSVPVIMVTSNQVNSDGGYAGLTAGQFVRKVNRLAAEARYEGPIVFGRDHGGPFIVEDHKKWSRAEAMAWVKKNIARDLEAGFTCWHADGTSGRADELENGRLPVPVIAETTRELIRFCEQERKRLDLGPLSYEVGSEEQQGGLTRPEVFERFLSLMTDGMREKDLEEAGLDFVVAQTGTHMKLHYEKQTGRFRLVQEGFEPPQVARLDQVAGRFRAPASPLLFTQHYSDHISPDDAAALVRFGAGKANFGPEMTMPELELLLQWEKKEREALRAGGRSAAASDFRQTMLRQLDRRPGFWRKFVPGGMAFSGTGAAPSIFDLPRRVQDALLVFRGRYVKSQPQCREAAAGLLENTAALGIAADPETVIIETILSQTIRPRLAQFHMAGSLDWGPM